MALLNDNYLKLKAGYLFPEIARRVKVFCEANPEAAKRLIRCGIGDVTEPLPAAVIAALHQAVDEMANRATFRGYGPEQGYDFLRGAIAKNDFRDKGLDVADDEVFVSDGSKCDCGNILDVLGAKNKIAISDPVYPVYVDTNVMAGHTGEANEAGAYGKLVYLPCKPSNGFVPAPPKKHVDIIYLCSPNNPTGAVAPRDDYRRALDLGDRYGFLVASDEAYSELWFEAPPAGILEACTDADFTGAIAINTLSKRSNMTGYRSGLIAGDARVIAAGEFGEELGSRFCFRTAGKCPGRTRDEFWLGGTGKLARVFSGEVVEEFNLNLHGADAFGEREFGVQRSLLEGGLAQLLRERNPLRA